jgi:hypothetical protein
MASMRRPVFDLLVFGTLLVLAGCGDEDGWLVDLDNGNVGGIPTNLTDPSTVVTSHAAALGARNLDAYMALLEPDATGRSVTPGFRFYPLDTDADLFPWMTGPSWGTADESRLIGNMFDPEFAGNQPPVDSIDMAFTILSQREVEPGLQEVTISVLIMVLTAPDEGFTTDTKFIVLLAKQADGYYRIREMREVPRQSRAGAALDEEASWGQIKNLYQ